MLKKLLSGAFLCLLYTAAVAQDEAPPKDEEIPKPLFGDKKIRPLWMDKLRYGGNVYAQFWNGFNLDISPMVGYEIGNSGKTVAGVGLAMSYFGQFKNGVWGYGPRVFVRQSIFRSIFAHAEFEYLNSEGSYFYGYKPPASLTKPERIWGATPYIGLGYYQGGRRTKGPFVAILLNPLYPNKGYRSPISIGGGDSPFTLRIGFF